ncbi:uncharacterized protein EKO05_0007705 [Ascochyta rabiei]|uniref:uncharacterized protein n=1 Tax=Didymella rabiei TaxID=5454 RepID=UPI00220DD36B|nr:uncharacterized protein EKO05_0007705 [Ascochyta rabiei]UPX17343.1 hypothetical protein EKO05_0007705 [Ascochyta rabiei]
MQHYTSPHPPPDVHPVAPAPPAPAPTTRSEPLIVGLFALRITKRLVEGLDNYSERDADIAWLADFLAPFPSDYDLAKLSGARKSNYLLMYPDIVSRMRRQPRYPTRFMDMNPVRPDRQDESRRQGGLTDVQRLEMIDFSDAALEWGSVVRLPASEMQRMIALADRRRVADPDATYIDLTGSD